MQIWILEKIEQRAGAFGCNWWLWVSPPSLGDALKPWVLSPCQNKLGAEAVRMNLHLLLLFWLVRWATAALAPAYFRDRPRDAVWCRNTHLLDRQRGSKSFLGAKLAWIWLWAPDASFWDDEVEFLTVQTATRILLPKRFRTSVYIPKSHIRHKTHPK